jgi:hypothetical protein
MGSYPIVPPYVWPYNDCDLRVLVSQWKIVERFNTAALAEGYLKEIEDDREAEGPRKREGDGYSAVSAILRVHLLGRSHLNEK